MSQRQAFQKRTRFASCSLDVEEKRCRNASIAPEYHDHCALVVDRHDVKKVMVGLRAGRGWGKVGLQACQSAGLARYSSFLCDSTNQMARRVQVYFVLKVTLKCCRAPRYR
jgi:hypothetical protein